MVSARAIVATDEIWVKVLKVQRRVNFPAQYLAAKARCVTFDEIQDDSVLKVPQKESHGKQLGASNNQLKYPTMTRKGQ